MEIFGDNLVLLEKLAAGGMGEVFLAKLLGKSGFEKSVAVKRIHPRVASDKEFQTLFENEVQLSALLHHPNIIQAFGNGEIDGYLYLVMEYIDGCTLLRLLKKLSEKDERMPLDVALLILCQACEGLAYAHDLKDESTGKGLNIIHRDLSPDNLMLSYVGVVKVVDFGIVKTANTQHTRTGTLKGKIAYMSPEQATGEVLDRRSDIFSLFSIFWECLAGERLFTAQKSELQLLKSVESVQLPDLRLKFPSLEPEILKMISKGLSKNRKDRYQSCDEVLKEVRGYLFKNFPETDRQKLAKYLQTQFHVEIQLKMNEREKSRPEAERFISNARLQLETKLQTQSKLVSEEELGEDDATKITEVPSHLHRLKNLHSNAQPPLTTGSQVSPAAIAQSTQVDGGNPIMMLLGGMAALLGIFGAFFAYEKITTKTLSSEIIIEAPPKRAPATPKTIIPSDSKILMGLPNFENSKFISEVQTMEDSNYKRLFLSTQNQKWKYWDAAEAPPKEWKERNFKDSLWKEGLAPLGYGDPVNTTISYGPDSTKKIPTAYFRRSFDIKGLKNLYKFILFGIKRDDAAVVYINGKQVFIDDFPALPVTHNMLSARLQSTESEFEFTYDSFGKENLLEGENVLAIEVHQVKETSSDLVMEFLLVGWEVPKK